MHLLLLASSDGVLFIGLSEAKMTEALPKEISSTAWAFAKVSYDGAIYHTIGKIAEQLICTWRSSHFFKARFAPYVYYLIK